jgi:hypothetical protein
MTDLHPWQVSTKLQPPIESSLRFHLPSAGEEVIRLDKKGFHYRGQFIEDAGEAHRLMVEFLRQGTAPALAEQPVGPTDEELEDFALQNGGGYFNCDCQEEADILTRKHVSNYRAVLARWGQS